MGFFDNLFGKEQPGPGWVRGTARVVSASAPPHGATRANISATLVVEVPGMAAYQSSYSKLACRVDKWPYPGETLPVAVDPRDARNLVVLWDEVVTGAEAGRQQAAAIVDQLNRTGSAPPPPASVPPTVSVQATQSDDDPVARLEKLAALRAAGIVTEAQFTALRAQILQQAGLPQD